MIQDTGYSFLSTTHALYPGDTNILKTRNARTLNQDTPGYTGTLNATCRPNPRGRHYRRSQKPLIQERNGSAGQAHTTATLSEAVYSGLSASPILVMSGPGPCPAAEEHAAQDAFDPSACGSTRGIYWSGRKRIQSRRLPGADLTAEAAGDRVPCDQSRKTAEAREADDNRNLPQCRGEKDLCPSLVKEWKRAAEYVMTLRTSWKKQRGVYNEMKTEGRTGNRLTGRITGDSRIQCSLTPRISGQADTSIGICRRTKSRMPLNRLRMVVSGYLCRNRHKAVYVLSEPRMDTGTQVVKEAFGFLSTFLERMGAFLSLGRGMTSDIMRSLLRSPENIREALPCFSFFYSTDVSTK